ncbi:MAG: hypothetical protein HY891_03660 [Deltaproteobacteria bacterium]|nr:hypothetical protein [Deltaproteobacteria bacterium]
MKIYKLPQLADSSPSSEYRLGPENSSAGSVYMVYGRIRPGTAARKVVCAAGHEEIICVVKGALSVRKGKSSFSVTAGEAFHAGEGETLYLETVGNDEAVYMAAGSLNAAAARPAPAEKRPAAPEPESIVQAPDAEDDEDEFEITTEDEPQTEEEKDIG